MALLEVSNLGIAFGGLQAVAQLDLSIEKGHLYGLIGPNGAGKTTVFNMLTGVYKPTEGNIILDGKDITGQNPELISKSGIARTFQNIRLFNDMTVLDNVKVGLHNQIRYNMWTGILRLPAYKEKEHEMNREAMKLLKIFDLDKEADYKASQLPYFHVALAVGIKVGAALAAAHGQGGQAVFEGLLKAEELQDALIDRGMEAQAALVGADGAVELHTVAAVHLNLALIVNPRHTEGDDALRLDQTLDQSGLLVLGVLLHNGLDALQNLAHSLQELRLVGIALFQTFVNALQVFIRQHSRILLFPITL